MDVLGWYSDRWMNCVVVAMMIDDRDKEHRGLGTIRWWMVMVCSAHADVAQLVAGVTVGTCGGGCMMVSYSSGALEVSIEIQLFCCGSMLHSRARVEGISEVIFTRLPLVEVP